MNPPQPFLSIGPVGTALLGWLAALIPLVKDLFLEPSAEEDWRVAWSMDGCAPGTHELREGRARPVVAVGGVSTVDRGYLAAVLPLLMLSLARTSAREHGRTARRRQGTDRGTTEFRKDELRPGGAVRRFGGACCVQDSVQHH
ncbi:hypothetical protein T484DRAFT_2477757 [Baffinella frigidus]|nr:hypothetical protein T484DRAFT_2477757 [Cryptophyta sp. CCMP2293]